MSWFSSKESDTKIRLDAIDEKIKVLQELTSRIGDECDKTKATLTKNVDTESFKTVLYYDGSLYQGYMENNQPHGFGIIVHGNGVRYTGNWKNGLYDGSGVLYYPGMPPWYAEWKSHVPHGKCTYDYVNYTEYKDGLNTFT